MPSNNVKYSEEFRERTCKHILETGKSATNFTEETRIDKEHCLPVGTRLSMKALIAYLCGILRDPTETSDIGTRTILR
jgi:hypothetical protein